MVWEKKYFSVTGYDFGNWLYRWYILPLMIFLLVACVALYVRKYDFSYDLDFTKIQWGASSWWSTSLCCPMRKSDEMIIGKPDPTLLNILISNTVTRVSNTQVNSRIHSRNIRSSRFGELKNSFLYLFETRMTLSDVLEIEFQSRRISNTESIFTSKHSFDIE